MLVSIAEYTLVRKALEAFLKSTEEGSFLPTPPRGSADPTKSNDLFITYRCFQSVFEHLVLYIVLFNLTENSNRYLME